MRLRRIKKHLKAIAADDALIAREGAGERLSAEELREALEERGMYVPSLLSFEFALLIVSCFNY